MRLSAMDSMGGRRRVEPNYHAAKAVFLRPSDDQVTGGIIGSMGRTVYLYYT